MEEQPFCEGLGPGSNPGLEYSLHLILQETDTVSCSFILQVSSLQLKKKSDRPFRNGRRLTGLGAMVTLFFYGKYSDSRGEGIEG